ncbi:MAG: hypothetical protein PHE96_11305 [Methylococcales bacterium]|nr:hypothetical protein [Methylococcales bacterium]
MSTETFIGVNAENVNPFFPPEKNIVCYVMQTYSSDSQSGFVVTDSQQNGIGRFPSLEAAFNFCHDHLKAVKFISPPEFG